MPQFEFVPPGNWPIGVYIRPVEEEDYEADFDRPRAACDHWRRLCSLRFLLRDRRDCKKARPSRSGFLLPRRQILVGGGAVVVMTNNAFDTTWWPLHVATARVLTREEQGGEAAPRRPDCTCLLLADLK